MLTSFFGKSSPLNFLLLGIYIFIIIVLQYFFADETVFDTKEILTVISIAGGLIFSMLLLDFIVRKNTLTQLNTYAILIFSCAAAMLLALIKEPIVVITNVFLLFALRRIYSLQSSKNTERKILDASLWIAFASYFYFWSLLLFIALYVAILLKPQKYTRYYLIPVVGLFGSFIIATAYHILRYNSFEWFSEWFDAVSFNFSSYAPFKTLVFITFFSTLLIWTFFSKIATLSSAVKKERPNHILTLYVLGVSLLLVLVSSNKNGAEFLYLLTPAAVVISGYIEKKSELWFKEILLWIFVLLPVFFVFM